MSLASRFAPQSPILRSDRPLSDDRIRAVVPSIFADAPHGSRSDRYAYIPTSTVLTKLRQEGFEPFMVCQTRVRNEDRREYTKHLIRLRHASQINGDEAKSHQRALLGIVNADVALNELLGLGTRDLDVEVAVAGVPGGADQRGDGASKERLRTAAAPDGHFTDTLDVADARGVEVEIRFLVGRGVHGESPLG